MIENNKLEPIEEPDIYTCPYCGKENDLRDLAKGKGCCNRLIWDYCCFETYCNEHDGS